MSLRKVGNWLQPLAVIVSLLLIVSGCGDSAAPVIETPAPDPNIETIAPIALADALPPVAIAIPEIELEISVVPMGWHIALVDGERTTDWSVPYTSAGWHVTSAGAGAAGNVVISGHQLVGEAVFARIAAGDVQTDQLIYLTDQGNRTFVYVVTDVSDPVPLIGATEDEIAAAQAYVSPQNMAQLTLVTGWPDFSTTHYLFVTARLLGAEITK